MNAHDEARHALDRAQQDLTEIRLRRDEEQARIQHTLQLVANPPR